MSRSAFVQLKTCSRPSHFVSAWKGPWAHFAAKHFVADYQTPGGMYHAFVSGHSGEGTEGGSASVGWERAGEDVAGYLIEPVEHV